MKIFEVTQESFNEYSENKLKAREGFDLSDFVNQRKESRLEGDIGHVYISGLLLSNAAKIDKQLGATDYKDIEKEIKELIEQGSKIILLHINSGGGSAMGCIELARIIQDCPIPTVSHVEGLGCSAAYKLCAGSTYVLATESSQVGNIGSIMVYADSSGMMANLGVSRYAFVNDGASFKSIGHLDSLTDEQVTYLQYMIDKSGEAFQNHVKSNRTVSDEVFTAAWYSGESAVEVGLIDEVGSEDNAIQRCKDILEALSTVTDDNK